MAADLTGGEAQAVMGAMGSRCKYTGSFACLPAIHFLLCCPIPNRPQTRTMGFGDPPALSLIRTLLDNDVIINPMVMEIKLRHMNNFWKYYLGLKYRSLVIKIHYSKEYNFISVQ